MAYDVFCHNQIIWMLKPYMVTVFFDFGFKRTTSEMWYKEIFLLQDVSRGLTELLAYEGNVEEDMCMSFQVSFSVYLNRSSKHITVLFLSNL